MAVVGKFGILSEAVKIKKSDGSVVDPAEETTLQLILDAISENNDLLQQILDKINIWVNGETPLTLDRLLYNTYYEFNTGTTKVYKNGIRQNEGIGNDYLENINHQSFTFSEENLITDVILVDYIKV